MPLYDVECPECGTVEDVVCSYDEYKAGPTCPTCGSQTTAKMPLLAVHRDYLDIKYFGDPRYADARRKQCGVPN